MAVAAEEVLVAAEGSAVGVEPAADPASLCSHINPALI
jgi:hypothetical protein